MPNWIPFLKNISDVADEIALHYFNSTSLDVEIKDNMTPVSAGDLAIENEIRSLVKKEHPNLSIIGEEYGETTADSKLKLIIDPIDGTKNFIRGLPFFGSLFAIEDDGHVVAGMVSAPALNDRWWASKGEGAFYGPKIEFVLRDAIGRDWQCGTLQVDLNLPSRLGATYVASDGSKKIPVMLHRALFGSLERFIGILIEHYAGKLPLWLSPLQVVVIPIVSEFDNYAKKIFEECKKAGINIEMDLKNQKLNYKIREHSLSKVPLLFICGEKESKNGSVTIRKLGSEKQETLSIKDAIKKISQNMKYPLN